MCLPHSTHRIGNFVVAAVDIPHLQFDSAASQPFDGVNDLLMDHRSFPSSTFHRCDHAGVVDSEFDCRLLDQYVAERREGESDGARFQEADVAARELGGVSPRAADYVECTTLRDQKGAPSSEGGIGVEGASGAALGKVPIVVAVVGGLLNEGDPSFEASLEGRWHANDRLVVDEAGVDLVAGAQHTLDGEVEEADVDVERGAAVDEAGNEPVKVASWDGVGDVLRELREGFVADAHRLVAVIEDHAKEGDCRFGF